MQGEVARGDSVPGGVIRSSLGRRQDKGTLERRFGGGRGEGEDIFLGLLSICGFWALYVCVYIYTTYTYISV